MKDIPIIFSAPMVLALLDGRKTMTRRLAWMPTKHLSFADLSSEEQEQYDVLGWRVEKRKDGRVHCDKPSSWQSVRPGDRLWVKETFVHLREKCKDSSTGYVDWDHYRATDAEDFLPGMKWKPSIFMPRNISRITLVVTATKIEPVQDISEADAQAEGFKRRDDLSSDPEVHRDAARDWFSDLWENLHGVQSWKDNPEVVALTFAVHKCNIDAMPKSEAA